MFGSKTMEGLVNPAASLFGNSEQWTKTLWSVETSNNFDILCVSFNMLFAKCMNFVTRNMPFLRGRKLDMFDFDVA
ncbi:hypothetical protein PAENIP36_11890 [Paenibacillus sp. P36]